ncbi:MAG: GDSL-type esterase/lipase family protein [Faecalibacterium sp.]
MRNVQPEKQPLTPLQKQSILVCAACALAVLLTAGITYSILKQGKKEPPSPEIPAFSEPVEEEDPLVDHYQIDQTSSALLAATSDAGESYLNETLFIGDSNTVRLYNNGLISLQQFCAKEGIGIQAARTEKVVPFKKDDELYTFAQAIAKMKPRRVVLTLGTNDNSMPVQDFIGAYTALVQEIQTAYPYTDIIVNTIPPIPENHSGYPDIDQSKIDDLNMALVTMCEQLDIKFLNSAEVLKDETGYGFAEYYTSGDIHLKSSGLKAMLHYLRTHAYTTADRRPDVSNIPTRTLEYTSNPSSAVQAPSSSQSTVQYEARYQVEKKTGGTLTCGKDTGKTSLIYSVDDPGDSFTVTAVPDEGYVFVKWSDGVTSKTRTDTKFKQNLDVTAVFASASVQISSQGSGFLNTFYTFKATVKGKYAPADSIRWYVNGEEVKEAAGKTDITFSISSAMLGETYKVQAEISYNDCTVKSNTLVIKIGSGVSSGSSSDSASSGNSSSGSSSSSSGSSSSSSSSSSSGSSSAGSSSSSGAGNAGSSASSSGASSGTSSGSTSSSSGSSSSSNADKEPASSSSASSSDAEKGSASSTASSGASSTSESTASKAESGSSSAASSKTENASSVSSSASSSDEGKKENASSGSESSAASLELSASREARNTEG